MTAHYEPDPLDADWDKMPHTPDDYRKEIRALRERCAAYAAAAEAEREACAKEAENEHRSWPPFCGIDGGEIVANDIAKAIRARGEENEAH